MINKSITLIKMPLVSDDDDLIGYFESIFLGECLCILAQLLLTIFTIQNILKKFTKFPIRQLSPIISITLTMCFLLANITNIIGRLIQNSRGYYDKTKNIGQCRLYNNHQMIALGFIYNFIRQLCIVLFVARTFRVCLCYNKKFYMMKTPPRLLVWIFKSQINILLTSFLYTILLQIGNFLQFYFSLNQQNAAISFQFFCPKKSNYYELFIQLQRCSLLTVTYYFSIHTYAKLDFKKFLLLFFLCSNSQLLLRMILVINELNATTYHELYYHFLIDNLFASVILAYFSNCYEKVNQPPAAGILENWKAFYNDHLSISVLKCYAKHIDQNEFNGSKHQFILQCFRELDQIEKGIHIMKLHSSPIQFIPHFKEILQMGEILKISQQKKNKLLKKFQQKKIQFADLKQLINSISSYCQKCIFQPWTKTNSFLALKQQFGNNSYINEKFSLLHITIESA